MNPMPGMISLRCSSFQGKDDLRLVHYEGVFHNKAYEDVISDMESRMYAYPQEIIDYLETTRKAVSVVRIYA